MAKFEMTYNTSNELCNYCIHAEDEFVGEECYHCECFVFANDVAHYKNAFDVYRPKRGALSYDQRYTFKERLYLSRMMDERIEAIISKDVA